MLNNSPAKDGRPSSAAGTFNSSARDRPGSGLSDPPQPLLHDHQFVSGPELPEALEKLEQKVAFVESAMEQLRHLVDLPPSELASGFVLDKFDGERTKIRAADHLGAQRLAESYLMSYRDIERRFEAQRRRMDVLEGRTARMETLFGEQIQLNKELGAEAVSALRRFVDREQRALKCWAEARATTEAHRLEKEKFKDQLGLLEEQNRQLDTQMTELTEEKLAISRKLVECQNDNHSLRMANDQLLHENQAQAKLLEIKDAQVDELLQRVQTSGSVLDEKELAIRRITMEREEMENRLAQERENFQEEQQRLRLEHERRLQEERAQLENRVQAEQLADAGRQQNSDKTVVESLQKAAEAHRKMEQQLERVSAEKRELEQNLDAYKRRFVAELNRELTAQCSRLGNGLNSALMEVLVRLNCEHSTTAASRLASGQPGQSGVTDNEPSTAAGEFTVQASSRTAQHFHQQQQHQSKQQQQQSQQLDNNNHNQHHPHTQSDSPPPPIQLDDSFNSPYSMSVPPAAAAANRNADVVIAPPKTNRNRNEGGGGGRRHREKENVPTAAAAQKQTNTAAGAGIRKRPLVNLIGASNGCSSIEPFLVSKQVPLEILRKTKPWRPPGCDPPPPGPAVRKTKQQQKRPHLQQHHQQQQAQTPPTTATMQKELGIGAPIFTSTPAKKRIFPKFQL